MSRQGHPRGKYVGGGYRGSGYSRRPYRGRYVPYEGHQRPDPSVRDLIRRELAAMARNQEPAQHQAGEPQPGPSRAPQPGPANRGKKPHQRGKKRRHQAIRDATRTGVVPAFGFAETGVHRTDPDWFAACKTCGAMRHLGKTCPNERDEQGFQLVCEYCGEAHNVHVCPTLHHRCAGCMRRGHRNKDCPLGNTPKVRQAFVKFIGAAPNGLNTANFKANVGRGFFALPPWVQYDLLARVTRKCYPDGPKSGDEHLASDIDMYNHVLAAVKELIAEEGITEEAQLDLNMKCSLVTAFKTYYGVVVTYGVSVSPQLELAKAERPPTSFYDLLPAVEEEEEEIEVRLPGQAKLAAQKEMFPDPPSRAEPQDDLADYDKLLEDDDLPLSIDDTDKDKDMDTI